MSGKKLAEGQRDRVGLRGGRRNSAKGGISPGSIDWSYPSGVARRIRVLENHSHAAGAIVIGGGPEDPLTRIVHFDNGIDALGGAEERLACYRYFGADMPASGGVPTLTKQLRAKRASSRTRVKSAERPPRGSLGPGRPPEARCAGEPPSSDRAAGP